MASHYQEAPFPEAVALSTGRLEDPRYAAVETNNPTSTPSHPHLPGEPSVSLAPDEVYDFLVRELNTPILDELYTRLWLVARKSGKSIDPLNRQKIKGRNIVPAEDPQLHLVWRDDKLYIKPIPVCLLNHHFWTAYLPSTNTTSFHKNGAEERFDRSVAIGFLRSYAFLIQHRTDFILAREHHLIPDHVDWMQWASFIAHFRHVGDGQVANRYHYGQLRLSRLNWAVRIFQPGSTSTAWFYEIPHWSTVRYMERAIAPLVFTFVSLSVVLSSMQVMLSVPADGLGFAQLDISGLQTMRRAFWFFPIVVLLLSGAIWTLLLVIPLTVICWQLSWGFLNSR